MTRRGAALAAFALDAAAANRAARAQGAAQGAGPSAGPAWPERPIRWIVPFPPAGTADILSRLLGERLSPRLGQSIVVENRAGAGGTLAATATAQARGDAHTVMVTNFAPHGVSPSLFANLAYDADRDFQHLGLLGALPMVIAVHPSVPATDIAAFLAAARAQRDRLSMAYGGNGTASHLIGLTFHRAAGIAPTFVPYRGAGPALTDVLAGTVPSIIETLPAALGHIRAGRLRPLAVSSAQRSAALPDIPTFAELGFGAATGVNWFGFALPAGVPDWLAPRWLAELRAVLAMPEVAQRLTEMGVEGTSLDPAATTAFVRAELARWREVVRTNNVTAD
ncbi:MAG: tripartite tricarboxylate transporter substrate binding protein [Acetobacteraceae bacterium]|nr:tripartite tricarboxylate transporter substrate binding protein [Acetobacteraceae bacterium]